MSVLTVAFHPSRPLIASAGADSLTKVFTTLNNVGTLNHSLPLQFTTSTSLAVNTISTPHVLSSSTVTSSSSLSFT